MSDLSNDTLLDLTSETVSWGRDVAEMWTGTLYEKQIDRQIESIEGSLKRNDLYNVRKLVYDLAQFLDNAESEFNEH